MKKYLLSLLLSCFIISEAFCWGANGHRVVGHIAQQHLTAKAKKKISRVLECSSLAEVSTWMDDIKSDSAFDHTHDWHWVTIPDTQQYEQTDKNPKGDVIAKIEEIKTALKAGNLPIAKEAEYVKYLVHLVGDLHQPLHVGRGDDKGGNDIKVTWFGNSSNLHRVWDSNMIDDRNLSYTELAGFLDYPNKDQIRKWQTATIRDMANESMQYRPQVYKLPENKKLDYQYGYENFDLVEARLLQAGIRLAGMLNEIYK